ncbi:hypothetical protein [Vitiosangium sp. GDMCC 1.1324]|uniref:hypothetical protein n=1 Tax=Vitiosangium sp. (strain GDMCC 1.1324) TaxID=2138576 RepID=UPI000D3C8891|nr:hypothetical protein [Vitiosangium sp. GDMCC 1.1324]PTL76577.1 hypothetical protein DAT35_49075 [Vitiosangium sp. GDMCC 1.1324]
MSPREPVRLLEQDSEASPELRELLGAASLDEPSAEQLAALAGKLGPLLGPPGGAPPEPPPQGAPPVPSVPGGVAGTAVSGVKGKVLAGMALAVLAGGSFQAGRLVERERARARPEEPTAVLPSSVPERAPVETPEPASVKAPAPEPASEESAPPGPVKPTPPPASGVASETAAPRTNAAPVPRVPRPPAPEVPRPTQLRPAETPAEMDEELTLLETAYQALRGGDAAGALEEAERHAARFPEGALAQEREVLAIDALVRMGRRTEAGARAETFRARYPTSTHWVRIQGLLAGPKP